MKTAKITALIFGMAAAALASLQAGVKVSVHQAKPTERIAFSYEAEGEVGRTTCFYRGTGESRHIGQAFPVAAGQSCEMTAVTFKLKEFDSAVLGKRFSLKVYRLAAVNKVPDPVNGLVSTQDGTLPESIDPEGYITFTLDEAVKLDQGGAYLVLFAFEEPTSTDQRANVLGFERTEAPAQSGRMWAYLEDKFVADAKSMTFFIQTP